MKKETLVDICCRTHGMSLSEFAKAKELKESTLKQWRRCLPGYGKVMLEALIENHDLKQELDASQERLARIKEIIV